MTDKINAGIDAAMNIIFDKEPLNYLEASGLFNIVAGGRHNLSLLEILYNHALDNDLKAMIKQAINEQTCWLMEQAEKILDNAHTTLPSIQFVRHTLHDSPQQIPDDARFSDKEIALHLANLARVSQMAVLSAMHQTYKPEIAIIYQKILNTAFDFDYRLLKLVINKGWLPHLPKIQH